MKTILSFLRSKLLVSSLCTVLAVPLVAEDGIPCRLFDPGFLEGDCNYHSLTSASDGMMYFTVSTHRALRAAKIFRFNPANESMDEVGDLSEILGTDPTQVVPQGKIHTPLIEDNKHLYFATHTSTYDQGLPDMIPDDGRKPYPGGHFLRYNLTDGTFENLSGFTLPSEGIITLTMDKKADTLFGLTWPTGLLLSYNLEEGVIRNWGAVQQRGEWGQLPQEWNFICRALAIDDEGNLYGGTDEGRIWHFDAGQHRPIEYYKNLNLVHVAPVQMENFEWKVTTHYFWENWRTIVWNPQTESFWGIQGGSTQLFEFKPAEGILRSVCSMRPNGLPKDTRRTMYRSQLGFMLGPKNTLLYLAHAPPVEVEGRPDLTSSVRLLSYDIDNETVKDHGLLTSPEGRRIFFTESIAIGPDDHIYTVAWVEVTDPSRIEDIQMARFAGVPDETRDAIYEIQLVQLPEWQNFIH